MAEPRPFRQRTAILASLGVLLLLLQNCADASDHVPESMQLSESLRAAVESSSGPSSSSSLYDAKLIPLEFSSHPFSDDTTVQELPDDALTLQQAALHHGAGVAASVAFVVRRPGCWLCREHGQQLSQLFAANNNSTSSPFSLWGIIKETSVDDEGLIEFYKDFFPFSLYRDDGLATYQAFGNRWISFNPFRKSWNLWKQFRETSKRFQERNLTGNLKGEGLVQGGVLLFDARGQLRFALEEEAGDELPLDDIQAALGLLMAEEEEQSQESKSVDPGAVPPAEPEL